MQVNSNRFGNLEVDDSSIITFPGGIPGFEDSERYVIVNCEQTDPIQWLISVDEEGISLPVINPFLLISDYSIEISDEELDIIQTHNQEEIVIYNVMVLYESLQDMTVNLLAPMVINTKKMIGIQIAMENTNYEIKTKAYGYLLEYYNRIQQEDSNNVSADKKE